MKCVICGVTISDKVNRTYVTVYRSDTPYRKLYACKTCGIDDGPFDRLIDALPVDGSGNPLDVKQAELEALKLATDRQRLGRRLRGAQFIVFLHKPSAKRDFGHGRFDFDKRQLIGDNGMVLQWQTRGEPDKPITYPNQQTREGLITLVKTRAKIIPAIRVTGCRTDCPNTRHVKHERTLYGFRCALKPYTLPKEGIPEWCPLDDDDRGNKP